MNEERTKDLPSDGGTFEERVFAEFAKLNVRLGNIETRLENVETRLENVETRLEKVEARLENVETHLQSLDIRLTTLEEKVDLRLRETRPIWEAVQNMLEELAAQMKLLVSDSFKMRARIERMEELRRPPAA